MDGGVRKKRYFIFVISNFYILPIIGWYFGGFFLALLGFLCALAIDLFFPTWKYDLSWDDIRLALNNIYKYGNIPCELTFLVDNRRIFIYRDEKDFSRKKQPPRITTRIGVRIPVEDWCDLYSEDDFMGFQKIYGGVGRYSSNRGPYSFGLFPKGEVDGCIKILHDMFEKAVGGLKPDIMARSIVNSKKIIWVDHGDQDRDEVVAPEK